MRTIKKVWLPIQSTEWRTNNLRKLEVSQPRPHTSSYGGKHISSTKNQRLDRLRQKYLNQLADDKKEQAEKDHLINTEKFKHVEPSENKYQTVQHEEGEEDKEEEEEEELKSDRSHKSEDKDASEIKSEIKLHNDKNSTTSSNRHRLQFIIQQLHEEKKKRLELEGMVQELLSKTSSTNNKLFNKVSPSKSHTSNLKRD